ncbi:MAG: hypothetical protein R3B82_12980 [Sandaracinaceae bacterium]
MATWPSYGSPPPPEDEVAALSVAAQGEIERAMAELRERVTLPARSGDVAVAPAGVLRELAAAHARAAAVEALRVDGAVRAHLSKAGEIYGRLMEAAPGGLGNPAMIDGIAAKVAVGETVPLEEARRDWLEAVWCSAAGGDVDHVAGYAQEFDLRLDGEAHLLLRWLDARFLYYLKGPPADADPDEIDSEVIYRRDQAADLIQEELALPADPTRARWRARLRFLDSGAVNDLVALLAVHSRAAPTDWLALDALALATLHGLEVPPNVPYLPRAGLEKQRWFP